MGAIENLLDERRQLSERIKAIDAVVAEYEAWERRASSLLSGHGEPMIAPAQSEPVSRMANQQSTSVLIRSTNKAVTPMPEFLAAVDAILDVTETPLDRNVLLATLEGKGVVVGGADPKSTLATRMTRLQGVTNIRGYGFWRRSRAFPPAGYAPALSQTENTEADDDEAEAVASNEPAASALD